ncbi:hypothetical protein [Cellulomonas sp. NPDC089187]|uniref:hypothetical protein n=1 Tax=Cellulomonas sp. NPDC089187 TaxID=3154970 RepID=UPI003420D1CB
MKPSGDTYGGRIVQKPDGTLVAKREVSKHGGPVIDIRYPDGRMESIRVASR